MVTPVRVVFFGTPEFAVPSLLALLESRHDVAGVVTQPDRPRGRGHKITAEAVKRTAVERGVPVLQPERLRDDAFLQAFRDLRPDLAVVAAYGRILPSAVLDVPPQGFINVHASLLPRWRGAAPVHRAILAGDEETGVTIMRVVPALDAGPMLGRASTAIDPNETSQELDARLADLGAPLLVRTVDWLSVGPLDGLPQNEADVTYAPRLERGESRVEWRQPALVIHDQIRGLQPWPLAAVSIGGRRTLLLRSAVHQTDPPAGVPGTVLSAGPEGLVVAAQPGAVRITELQPEGRRPMNARDFLNGTHVRPGDTVEPAI